MRVILRENLDNLGKAGEVVTVRTGYGRNYLLPNGLAVPATEKDEARLQHEQRRHRRARWPSWPSSCSPRPTSCRRCRCRWPARWARKTSSTARSPTATSPRPWPSRASSVDARKIQLDEPIKTLGMTEVASQAGPRRHGQDQGLGRQEGSVAAQGAAGRGGREVTEARSRPCGLLGPAIRTLLFVRALC